MPLFLKNPSDHVPSQTPKIKQTPQASITYKSFTVLLFQNGKLTVFFCWVVFNQGFRATQAGFDAAIIRSLKSNDVEPIGGGSGKFSVKCW